MPGVVIYGRWVIAGRSKNLLRGSDARCRRSNEPDDRRPLRRQRSRALVRRNELCGDAVVETGQSVYFNCLGRAMEMPAMDH